MFSRDAELIPKERLQTEGACEELLAAAAAAAGVNLEGLKLETRKWGCRLTGSDEFLFVDLTIFNAKKSMRSAQSLFELDTRNVTKAEAEATMLSFAERGHQRDPSKKVDREAIAAMVEAMPPPRYVEVAGIGRQARMTTTRGRGDAKTTYCAVHVVVRNVLFTVSASGQGLDEDATVTLAKGVAKTVAHKISKM